FRLDSSDAKLDFAPRGILTPAYLAIDDLTLESPATPSADFNGDLRVDGVDLTLWFASWTSPPVDAPSQSEGDANGDGRVDGWDFLQWQREFGLNSTSEIASFSVPEPGALAWLAPLGLITQRRPSRRRLQFN
ncbi:MAG: hypothetical protein KDA61_21350, partial [Planctomycetales bacterium]|nr:hypothetical protein [Planctomycetales bacterium]